MFSFSATPRAVSILTDTCDTCDQEGASLEYPGLRWPPGDGRIEKCARGLSW